MEEKIAKYQSSMEEIKSSMGLFSKLNCDVFEMIKIPNGPVLLVNQQFKVFFGEFYDGEIEGKMIKDVFPEKFLKLFENTNDHFVIERRTPKLLFTSLVMGGDKMTSFATIKFAMKLSNGLDIILLVGFNVSKSQVEYNNLLDDKGMENANRMVDIINSVQGMAISSESRIEEDNRNLKENLAKLTKIVSTDSLTGIYNRRRFEEDGEVEIKKASRYGADLSLLVIDVDEFKKINDKHGHIVGDVALKALVNLMEEDIRETDLFCRWGGEEFTIILHTKKELAKMVAEKIRSHIEQHTFPIIGRMTISIGVTQYEIGQTLDEWFHKTDRALYKAKVTGRNQVVCL